MEVNVSKLNDIIDDYYVVIDKIKNNNSQIAMNFVELSKCWNDPMNKKMITRFNREKTSYNGLESDIRDQLSTYKYIASKYGKIGDKIKCNLNKKDSIDSKLTNIVNQLNTIIWQYDNLGDLSWCPLRGVIYEQRDDLQSILNSFESIKSSISDKLEYISSVESEVLQRANNNSIEYIAVNNYESES